MSPIFIKTIVTNIDANMRLAWADDILTWRPQSQELGLVGLHSDAVASVDDDGNLLAIASYDEDSADHLIKKLAIYPKTDTSISNRSELIYALENTDKVIYIATLSGKGGGGGSEIIRYFMGMNCLVFLDALKDAMAFYKKMNMKRLGQSSIFYYIPPNLKPPSKYVGMAPDIAIRLTHLTTDIITTDRYPTGLLYSLRFLKTTLDAIEAVKDILKNKPELNDPKLNEKNAENGEWNAIRTDYTNVEISIIPKFVNIYTLNKLSQLKVQYMQNTLYYRNNLKKDTQRIIDFANKGSQKGELSPNVSWEECLKTLNSILDTASNANVSIADCENLLKSIQDLIAKLLG